MTQRLSAEAAPQRPSSATHHPGDRAGRGALPADPLWYKDALIYEVSVRAFQDGNGDGIGDFRGLTQRVDYLSKLGINCVWLLPFYPSPLRDGGYDISDYSTIHPDLGTMRDFRDFIRAAHGRGIRVITELVVNHTSDQHPWFQRARHAPRGSAARNMYVWTDDPSTYAGTRIIFSDTETSNWTWDPVAGQYYWHRFFHHQPDLNFANRRVVAAVKRYMKFWFDAGVDGLRLDAVPYLCEREGTTNQDLPETHAVLRELRAFVEDGYDDRMLLAEANGWPADVVDYFGRGDECHMAFHFPVMPRLFMALRQEDRHPIVDILDQTPEIPEGAQWVLFLRNHDELTLEMVADEERDYMYSAYAADPRMRMNVGIRRRFAPLLSNSRRAMELLNSLLFSMPGTPLLYYGDEIGMGDNIFLGDRDGVRTPMQWDGDRNAGFSSADPARMSLPVIVDPVYGYQAVNVEAQERSPSSFLNWMRRMIALRRERRVFGRGSMEMLHPANRSVLAFVRRFEGETVLVVANLSRFVQPAQLDLSEFVGSTPVEMLGKASFPVVGDDPYPLSLGPHAFYWFDLQPRPASSAPGAGADGARAELTVAGEWSELVEAASIAQIERALPAFLGRQPWFGQRERAVRSIRVRETAPLLDGANPAWWMFIEATFADGGREVYSFPLAVVTGRGARRIAASAPEAVFASVRGPQGQALVCDALAVDAACVAVVEAMHLNSSANAGTVVARHTRTFGALFEALDEVPSVTREPTDDFEPSVRLGSQFVLRLVRRVQPGAHAEAEMSRHLRAAGFEHAPAFAGSITYRAAEAEPAPLALLHDYVWNQRDGWQFTLGQLARYFEEANAQGPAGSGPRTAAAADPLYADAARLLGQRTAEMHIAAANSLSDAAFEPEPFTSAVVKALIDGVVARAGRVTLALRAIPDPDAELASAAEVIGGASRRLRSRLRGLTRDYAGMTGIRVHGDYELRRVLWARNDFTIVGFAGESRLPQELRRAKAGALQDVASMLHSFTSAAEVGLREFSDTMPARESVAEGLRHAAQRWVEGARSNFMAGYLARTQDAVFLPAEGARGSWTEFYLIERALRDLELALTRDPERLGTALRGATALLAVPPGGPSTVA